MQITAVKNNEEKENTATSGKLIIAVYASYVCVYGPDFKYSGLVPERQTFPPI